MSTEKLQQNNNPEFNSKHPRDSDGKFTSKNGGSSTVSYTKNGSVNSFRTTAQEDPKGNQYEPNKNTEEIILINNSQVAKSTGFRKHTKQQIDKLINEKGFNNPEIKDFLNEIEELRKNPTNLINTPERNKSREYWLNNEFNLQLNSRTIKKERIATIILGLPASGKSSIADPLKTQYSSFEIDADIFKDYIPEYRKNAAAVSQVHEESSDLTKEFQKRVMAEGYNMVIPKVGGNKEKMAKIIGQLKEAGYTVNLTLAQLPIDKALERDMGRYVHGKEKKAKALAEGRTDYKEARLVNPSLIVPDEGLPIATYEYCKKLCNAYGAWSTDVPRGAKPKLIEKSKNMISL